MKTFLHIAVYLLIFLGLSGCNGDVFIEDFQPSVSDVTLDGNGDSVTIHFKSSNWNLLHVYDYYDNSSLYYSVYDKDGNIVSQNQSPVLEGLGKIVCDDVVYEDKIVDFTIERTHPQEVKLTVNENARSSLFRFSIIASNEYETKAIHVAITPSDRYIFDHITYSLDMYSYTDTHIEERRSMVIDNRGNGNVTNYIFPFQNEYRQIQFTSNNPEAFNLLASKPEVEIPGIVDGYLVMNGERVQYASDMQRLPLPFPDTEKKAVITPAQTSQRITVLLEYEWFETYFTLYAVHPKTKKEKVITGTLKSKMPKRYLIKCEKLNN
ncbi:hypothetical protein [Phocaeicola faecalis]